MTTTFQITIRQTRQPMKWVADLENNGFKRQSLILSTSNFKRIKNNKNKKEYKHLRLLANSKNVLNNLFYLQLYYNRKIEEKTQKLLQLCSSFFKQIKKGTT